MKVWQQGDYAGRMAWFGETEAIRVVLIPELGAKLVSILDKRSGREWLAQTDRLGNQGYDTPFDQGDLRGWDEMFPTIDRCLYPLTPWEGTAIPDHGEVWSIPWQSRLSAQDELLVCQVHGVRFPYHLEKRMRLDGEAGIVMDYEVVNLSPFPFSYLWAAHPLFQVEPGMRLVVPYEEGSEVILQVSKHDCLGQQGAKLPWPAGANGTRLDLVPDKGDRYEKYYFCETPREGWARLEHPATGESVTMEYPVGEVPFLAIWANYGGYYGGYHVAIEPATGYLDALSTAVEHGKVRTLPAHGSHSWRIRLVIGGRRISTIPGEG